MENSDQKLMEMLKQDCHRIFKDVSKGLFNQSLLTKTLPDIRLGFCKDPKVKARIGYMPGREKTVLVTISEDFLFENYQAIMTHMKVISAMMRVGTEDRISEDQFDIYLIMEAIYDLSLQYVLHHELFHLLNGHLDLQKGDMRLASIDESDDMSYVANNGTEENILRYYFREMEADGSSIGWIINKLVLGSVNNILIQCQLVEESYDDAIIGLNGTARLFAYKMMFIAIWLVISLIEKARGHKMGNGDTHPFPVTRIISFIHTLLEFYAELSGSTIRKDGRFATLDENNISQITEFQEGITLPFCIFFREFPDASKEETELNNIDDFDFTNSVMSIVKESSNILINGAAKTIEGLQVKSIESVRAEMVDVLYTYRYLEEEII